MRHKDYVVTHEAARQFMKECLETDGSLFSPGKRIWTLPLLEELHLAFVQNPDDSSDSFLEKFERQLKDVSDDVKQLASEVLWVHFLSPMGTSGEKKREIIGEVLSWMKDSPELPEPLSTALDHGFVKGGLPFSTGRAAQLSYLIEFVRHWKGLPRDEVTEALSDPWRFREIAWAVDVHGGQSQREALLFLIHPDTFEANISREALEKIANRFSHLVDDPTAEVHRQVLQIRKKLSEEYGGSFRFYDPEIRTIWSPDNTLWGQLIHWMRLFFEDPSFDQNERDYKVELADSVNLARQQLMDGSEAWFEHLAKALQHPENNITPWRMRGDFLEWAETHEADTAEGLKALWEGSGTVSDRIDGFLAAVPKDAMKGGLHTRLNLAAYLLMAEDPATYPPYRYGAFKSVMALVDH